MKTVGDCRMRRRRENQGRRPTAGLGFFGRRQQAPSQPVRGSGGALWTPPAGFGAEPRPPKGFPLFSTLRMASPDNNLLTVDQKLKGSFLSRSILSQLLWIWWCCVMFIVYETKFTVGKSKEMVFKCISLWQYWSNIGELDTFWGGGISPKRCLDKTMIWRMSKVQIIIYYS